MTTTEIARPEVTGRRVRVDVLATAGILAALIAARLVAVLA